MFSKRRGFKGYLAKNFNFGEWLGKDFLIAGYENIVSTYRALTRPKKVEVKETFAEAIVRLNLSEKDLREQQSYFRITASIYASFIILGLGYAIWLYFFDNNLLSACMAVIYSTLMFSLFFRESFWYMQIKKRKLGHTLGDWLQFISGRYY